MSTEKKLVRENKSFIAPLIELLQTHPLTSKRMAQIKKYARKQN
jgi:Zn-dependent protease with chaperone function